MPKISDIRKRAEKEAEHGIANAYYALTPMNRYDPVLECICGFCASNTDWEETGAEFDNHLEEVGAS